MNLPDASIKTTFFSFFILSIVSLLVIFTLTPYGIATTPDSTQYIEMASNFSHGYGFTIKERTLDSAFLSPMDSLYHSQNLWPKLYPFILSPFVDGLSHIENIKWLSSLLLTFTALFTFLLLAKRAHWLYALFVSITVIYLQPMLTLYSYAWSEETLFVPLLILLTLTLSNYLDNSANKTLLAVCITAVLLALFFTRYIGGVFSIILLYIMLKEKRTLRFIWLGLSALYFLFVVTALFTNNFESGSATGGARAISDKTLLQNIQDMAGVLLSLHNNFYILSCSALIALIMPLLLKTKPLTLLKGSEKTESTTIFILLSFALIYTVGLLILRTISQFDAIDIRLMSPALICIYIAAALFIPYVFNKNNTCNRSWLMAHGSWLMASFMLSSITHGYYLYNTNRISLANSGSVSLPMNQFASYNNFTVSAQYDPLKAHILSYTNEDSLIGISSRPLIHELRFQRSAFLVPDKLNENQLNAIQNLPAKSILIIEKGHADISFFNLFETVDAGSHLVVHLP